MIPLLACTPKFLQKITDLSNLEGSLATLANLIRTPSTGEPDFIPYIIHFHFFSF